MNDKLFIGDVVSALVRRGHDENRVWDALDGSNFFLETVSEPFLDEVEEFLELGE